MELKKCRTYYVLRLKKNEEIITSLEYLAKTGPLSSAFFFGLGVGKNIVLGYFDAHKQTYVKKVFKGEYEFTSFSGNISHFKKKPVIHCHVTITDYDFIARGGHLFQATVPATMEILLLPILPKMKRRKDSITGLNLLDIS